MQMVAGCQPRRYAAAPGAPAAAGAETIIKATVEMAHMVVAAAVMEELVILQIQVAAAPAEHMEAAVAVAMAALEVLAESTAVGVEVDVTNTAEPEAPTGGTVAPEHIVCYQKQEQTPQAWTSNTQEQVRLGGMGAPAAAAGAVMAALVESETMPAVAAEATAETVETPSTAAAAAVAVVTAQTAALICGTSLQRGTHTAAAGVVAATQAATVDKAAQAMDTPLEAMHAPAEGAAEVDMVPAVSADTAAPMRAVAVMEKMGKDTHLAEAAGAITNIKARPQPLMIVEPEEMALPELQFCSIIS